MVRALVMRADEARRLEEDYDKFTSMASGGATKSGQLIIFGGIDVATNVASQTIVVFQTGDRECNEGGIQFYGTDCDVSGKRSKIWEGSSIINGLLTGGSAILIAMAIFYQKRKSLDSELSAKDEYKRHESLEDEVIARFRNRVTEQRGWIAVEVGDFVSDLCVFITYASLGNHDVLFFLYLAVLCVTTPAFIHNVSTRSRILAQYHDILSGGETIAAYVEVLDKMKSYSSSSALNINEKEGETDEIDADNLALRLELVAIDIITTDLGLQSALLEDIPCIIINFLALF